MLGNRGSKRGDTRGTTRGGQAQFNWEDVKLDKDRENYLGHSVLAPVGRWQKGKDLSWYAKNKGNNDIVDAAAEERKRMREMDEELLNSALGYKTKKSRYLTIYALFCKI